MEVSFSRHRYELPILAAFFSVAIVELLVVHLVAAQWSRTLAWILSAGTALLLLQIGLLVHGFIKWPMVANEAGLVVRHGRNGRLFVPYSQMSGVEDVGLRPEERGPHVLRTTIIAHPNVALRLVDPIRRGRKDVTTILMRLDEPSRLHELLGGRLPVDRASVCRGLPA